MRALFSYSSFSVEGKKAKRDRSKKNVQEVPPAVSQPLKKPKTLKSPEKLPQSPLKKKMSVDEPKGKKKQDADVLVKTESVGKSDNFITVVRVFFIEKIHSLGPATSTSPSKDGSFGRRS